MNTLLIAGRYRSVHVAQTWMLEEMKGEHPEVDLSMISPDPVWPPELVVQAQLEALRSGFPLDFFCCMHLSTQSHFCFAF